MPPLSEKKCVPCRGGVPPLDEGQIRPLAAQVPEWEVVQAHHLRRVFPLPDFRAALDLVDRIGALAEEEWHHPSLKLEWGRVEVEIWTHKVGGLSESDFILAAKIDQIALARQQPPAV
jgi:4a-hydroxytetrahydrobiopterin dehydratase